VGWSIDSSQTAVLVTNALGMAIDSRLDNSTTGTIIHSDQGVQFGSWAFTKRARDSGLLASMGSVGDGYDNSMIESFWSRMQVELLDVGDARKLSSSAVRKVSSSSVACFRLSRMAGCRSRCS